MEGKLGEYLERFRRFLRLDRIPPRPRKVLVGVVGGTLLLIGMTMILLPGPAFIVIPLSLALLATEFVWARRYLRKARGVFDAARQSVSKK